jgi:hypothetical protein
MHNGSSGGLKSVYEGSSVYRWSRCLPHHLEMRSLNRGEGWVKTLAFILQTIGNRLRSIEVNLWRGIIF